jgi:hypothetical protein
MPPSFRTPVTKFYPLGDRLALCDGLGDLIDEIVLSSMPRAQRPGSGERMILARWAHAQTTYGALLTLAREQPDGQSVVMLSRPVFEAMVDAYWIASNPLKAQDLAVKHFRLLRLNMAEFHNARGRPGDPALPIDRTDLADRAALATLFGAKARTHWTRLDLRARARAVDADIPQDFPNELEGRYDEDNQLANLLIHGSPMAMNDRLVDTPRGITVQLGPTEQHLANGLRRAYWSYYRLGWLLASRLKPDSAQATDAAYRDGWPKLQTITAGALKAAGRNGACPCGSDAKTKDCHGSL